MQTLTQLPRYDILQSYDWNYDHVPEPVALDEPPFPGEWDYCGLPARSPLGIAAGPLLNGRWIRYYASLGFDVLTYKTARSAPRTCYELPNLKAVPSTRLHGGEERLLATKEETGSWAISFGMPSKAPETWQADVAATKASIEAGKLLSVSVVASPKPEWTLKDLANDFAGCIRLAVEAGADCVEANFSCPNVNTADGQLFQQPNSAGVIARAMSDENQDRPLLLKIGHITDPSLALQLLTEVSPFVDALVMVNGVSATIVDEDGASMFDGQRRGIGGKAIRDAALRQIQLFDHLIKKHQFNVRIIGVGGISTLDDVNQFLEAGAHSVQLATAAMLDPGVGLRIKQEAAG